MYILNLRMWSLRLGQKQSARIQGGGIASKQGGGRSRGGKVGRKGRAHYTHYTRGYITLIP